MQPERTAAIINPNLVKQKRKTLYTCKYRNFYQMTYKLLTVATTNGLMSNTSYNVGYDLSKAFPKCIGPPIPRRFAFRDKSLYLERSIYSLQSLYYAIYDLIKRLFALN